MNLLPLSSFHLEKIAKDDFDWYSWGIKVTYRDGTVKGCRIGLASFLRPTYRLHSIRPPWLTHHTTIPSTLQLSSRNRTGLADE